MASHRLFLFFLIYCHRPSALSNEISDNVKVASLRPSEIALVQYDSRRLSNYWLVSAQWNNAYAIHHGHKYIYYDGKNGFCRYSVEEKLANPWCKVKSMIQSTEDFPEIKLFIYMDSDAVIDKFFVNVSVNSYLKFFQEKLSWNPFKKPIVFNQDGPCWWCNLIQKAGYVMCLNAGTVMWYRHPNSAKVLTDWWHSSMDSYADNPLKRCQFVFAKMSTSF